MGVDKKTVPNVTPVSNDSMRSLLQEAIGPLVGRVDRLEEDVRGIDSRLDDITEAITKHRAEEAESLSRVAAASARAVDIALKAQTEATGAKGEMTNIVASALKIHSQSIAQTVDHAVKAAVQPLSAEVESLQTNDGNQNDILAAQNRGIVVIARELGVEDKLDPALRGSLPPPKDDEKRAPAFPALETKLRNSQMVQLLIAVAILARVLWEIIAPHH